MRELSHPYRSCSISLYRLTLSQGISSVYKPTGICMTLTCQNLSSLDFSWFVSLINCLP